MCPSLNAGFVRSSQQVMGIPEGAENLLPHGKGNLVDMIHGNANEVVDVTGSPPHAFARTDLRLHTHLSYCSPCAGRVFLQSLHICIINVNETLNTIGLIISPACCMLFSSIQQCSDRSAQ